jgi:hypothetical protein
MRAAKEILNKREEGACLCQGFKQRIQEGGEIPSGRFIDDYDR